MSDSSGIEEEQTRMYSEAIGNGIPSEVIDDLGSFVQDAQPHQRFSSQPEVRFMYEMMVKPDWQSKIKPAVNQWIEVWRALLPNSSIVLTTLTERIKHPTRIEARGKGFEKG